MNMKTAAKPRSFRVDDATIEKIQAITEHVGGNQQDALQKMVEAYEFQMGMALIPNKKNEIQKFERHISVLSRLFMDAMEESETANDTISAGYEARMISKEQTIQTMQETLAKSQASQKTAEDNATNIEAELNSLQSVYEMAKKEFKDKKEQMERMLADKNELNRILSQNNTELKSALEDMREDLDNLKDVESSLNDAYAQITLEQTKYKTLEDSLDSIREQAKKEIVLEKEAEILSLKLLNQEEIKKVEDKYRLELDKMRERNEELMQKLLTSKE